MNVLFLTYFCVGCMVSEKLRLSVFGYCPYSVTVRIRLLSLIYIYIYIYIDIPVKCLLYDLS